MPFSHCGTLIPRIGDDHVVATAWERFLQHQSVQWNYLPRMICRPMKLVTIPT